MNAALPPRRVGLVLGKFAPLHQGHQFLIETALREMDQVIVAIYDCSETFVPLNVRSRWLRTLYPAVRVIEAWDGPTEVGNTPEIQQRHENYVLNELGLRQSGITHFYSSEFYGEHMSRALNATNRVVDRDRDTVPVSGTRVRQNPFAFRDHVSPVVYRDLVTHVVFLGAPSTGKTTLAARMAREYQTVWMPEYGREYWETHQIERRLSLAQLVEIAQEHRAREEELLYQADRYLFTDTNATTTFLFALHYHGHAPEQLVLLAQDTAARYDLVFVCDTDIPYEDTWDRSGDVNRTVFQKRVIGDLSARRIPFFVVRGTLDHRVRCVQAVLDKHQKYQLGTLCC